MWHRSAFTALLLALGSHLGACAPLEPEVRELTIRAHSLDESARCRIETNPSLTLRALGPFPVSDLGAEVLPDWKKDRTLTFPGDTQGLEAQATDFDNRWHGYTDRRTERGLDVLLWKEATGSAPMDCDLFHSEDYPGPDYPGSAGGQAAGYSPEAGVVLAAGGDSIDTAGAALAFDANTGEWFPVTELPFSEARAFATITPFGSGLLLAGGEAVPLDPTVPVAARDARDTAAVYDPIAQGFVGGLIQLELRRTRHAAVVLESGETLLVGGGQPTTDGRTVAVAKFEIVSPRTRLSTLAGVDGLAFGRLSPSAIRLDNGNVLVGGGYDADGAPVEAVEWFSPDASGHVSPGATQCGVMPDPPCAELEPRHHRSFVALPGGGALTVGACAPGEQDDTCESACGEGFGCPAPEPDATWIAPDGGLTAVQFEQPTSSCSGTSTIPFSPERVVLAPGSDGSPWLFASDDDRETPCRAIFRFQPWGNGSTCPSTDPGRCPVFVPVERTITDWPDLRTRLTSLGADAFVWITEGASPFFAGARAGVRGALSQNETLLVTDPSAPGVPLHLAPDRPPDAPPGEDPEEPLPAPPKAIFVAESGRLILETSRAGLPAVGVYITDARYDEVTLTLGFSGDGPPLVLLGSYELGGDSCPWPENPLPPFVITRRGSIVTTTDATGGASRCETAPSGSVALGFRAGRTSTTITSLGVKRD